MMSERKERREKKEKKEKKKEKKENKKDKKHKDSDVSDEESPPLGLKRAKTGLKTPTRVCDAGDLSEGECEVVQVDGEEVGVWRVTGDLYAIGNRCSHRKTKLNLGDIEDLDGPAVMCPKHRSKFGGGLLFSLKDGHSFTPRPCSKHKACWAVKTYHAFENQGIVYIQEGAAQRDPQNSQTAKVELKSRLTSSSAFATESVWRVDQITRESKDTRIFHLARPGALDGATSKTEPGWGLWHVSVTCPKRHISRDYTPVSSWKAYLGGKLDLLIKMYEGGELTGGYLAHVQPSEYLEVGQPEPTLDDGQDTFLSEKSADLQLGCVAGGTGITPIVQAARSILTRRKKACISLLYSSRTVEDILMQPELDELVCRSKQKGASVEFEVVHTLTQSEETIPPAWQGKVGRIDESMLFAAMPKPGVNTKVLVCGPQGMLEASNRFLLNLGYSSDMIVQLDA